MYTYRVHHLEPDDIKEISHGLSTMVIALKRKKGLHEVYIQPNDVLQLGDLDEGLDDAGDVEQAVHLTVGLLHRIRQSQNGLAVADVDDVRREAVTRIGERRGLVEARLVEVDGRHARTARIVLCGK